MRTKPPRAEPSTALRALNPAVPGTADQRRILAASLCAKIIIALPVAKACTHLIWLLEILRWHIAVAHYRVFYADCLSIYVQSGVMMLQ